MAESIASLFYVPCCLTFYQLCEGSFSFQITLDKPKRRWRRKEKEEVLATVMKKKVLLPQSGTNNELYADERLGEGGCGFVHTFNPSAEGDRGKRLTGTCWLPA